MGAFAAVAYLEVRRITVAAARERLKRVTAQLETVLRTGEPQRLDEVSRLAAERARYTCEQNTPRARFRSPRTAASTILSTQR